MIGNVLRKENPTFGKMARADSKLLHLQQILETVLPLV
jgi:hypothetical protein